MKGTTAAATPMMTAPVAVTKPVAGVITTRPATAPEQKPSTEACFLKMNSRAPQTKEPTAVASVVVMNALAAIVSAATADPALKPYQPTQSMPVPTIQSTMEWGAKDSLPKPRRLPRIRQSTRADQPEDMWTTVPPAKSIARILASPFQTPFMKPSTPQTMWARGK